MVAPKYDVVTRVLSFGNDGLWKRRLLAMLPARITGLVVDIACGTGDSDARIASERSRDARWPVSAPTAMETAARSAAAP